MSDRPRPGPRHAARLVALLVIGLLYLASRPPALDGAERHALAQRFAFTGIALVEWTEGPRRTRRSVNPAFERHSGWISAVGAAVALADLDGDGLPNDVCHVDPRTNRLTVAPAPATGDRYPIFELSLVGTPLAWQASTMAPMGCVPSDVDEDGRLDLLVYYWGRTPVVFLRRSPALERPSAASWLATPVTSEAVEGERWFTNAATFADLDGDGHLDLVVGNYFQDGAKVLDAHASDPDSMQQSMSRAYNGGRNRTLRWVGPREDGGPGIRFEEVEGVFGERADAAWTLAVGAADLDGDLMPELYFANDFGPDRLFHNRSRPGELRFALAEGSRSFTKPRSKVLGRDSFKGMGVDFADLNHDGLPDIFVSNIAAEYALEESHFLFLSDGDPTVLGAGIAPYEDVSEALGVARSSWSWDTRFGDFDNDGVLELLQATGFTKGHIDRWPELQELAMGNDQLVALWGSWPRFQAGDDLSGHAPNPFYVRGSDGRYHDLAEDLGLAAPHVTRGIATGDVDGDGDLDFAIANQWEPSYLYRNERRAGPDFLGLHLLLPVGAEPARGPVVRLGHPSQDLAGRPAVGAAVRVERVGLPVLSAQVDGGSGHSGVRSPALHFGLGDAVGAVRVEIRYRDRHGRPARFSTQLSPGWHTLLLPDAAPALAAAGVAP